MRGIFKLAVIAGLVLGACGSGDGGEDLGRFTGTWSTVSGTLTDQCPSFGTATIALTGNIIWSKGVASDLVQSSPPSSCIINADVTATTASGSGPPCVIPADGGTLTFTVAAYTFVLSPDGRTAQENGSGTLVVNRDGATETCTVTETASYQKIGL
jgi:hypothetical protein